MQGRSGYALASQDRAGRRGLVEVGLMMCVLEGAGSGACVGPRNASILAASGRGSERESSYHSR